MARQITVLEQNDNLVSGTRLLQCIFWYAIVPAKRIPVPGFVSRATAVTSAEQADLESGAIKEESVGFEFPTTYTPNEMKALVNKRYTDKLTAVTNESNKRLFYGSTYDSITGWSV